MGAWEPRGNQPLNARRLASSCESIFLLLLLLLLFLLLLHVPAQPGVRKVYKSKKWGQKKIIRGRKSPHLQAIHLSYYDTCLLMTRALDVSYTVTVT